MLFTAEKLTEIWPTTKHGKMMSKLRSSKWRSDSFEVCFSDDYFFPQKLLACFPLVVVTPNSSCMQVSQLLPSSFTWFPSGRVYVLWSN